MENKGAWLERAAANSVPNPANYPLGSPQSRAAARALFEARARVSVAADEGQQFLIILQRKRGEQPDDDECIDAIHRSYRGPGPRFHMIVLGEIPSDVNAETKEFLLEHGWKTGAPGGYLPSVPAIESDTAKLVISDLFSRMSPEELEDYAKFGALPAWAERT